MKNTRAFTGILVTAVYIAIVVLSAYVHPLFLDVFILAVAVLGTYEMGNAVSKMMSPNIVALNMTAVGVGFGAFWFAQYFFRTYSAGLAGYMVALVVMILVTLIVTASSKKYVRGNAASTVLVMMYPGAILMFTMAMNYFIDVDGAFILASGATPYRSAAIGLQFIVPAFTDMFVYLVGSRLKGKKLAPKISPNKTISGAIGGLLGGLLAAGIVLLLTFLGVYYKVNICGLQLINDNWTVTIVVLLVLGLFGSVFDQLGDLLASYIKRQADIKDFSNLLPGHGGIIDRVDGFMLSGVFYYLFFAVLILI